MWSGIAGAGNTSSSSSSSSPPPPPPPADKGILNLAPIEEEEEDDDDDDGYDDEEEEEEEEDDDDGYDDEEEEPSEEEEGEIKEMPLSSKHYRLPPLSIPRPVHKPLLLNEGKNIRKRLFFPPSLPVAEPGAAGSADISLLSSLNESAGKGIRKRLVLPRSSPFAKEDMRPTIGNKEPLSELAAEYSSDNYIIQEKIKLLEEKYSSFRRTRRDGNCFFRSFLFSYLEHIVEMQDEDEVDRIIDHLELYKLDCEENEKLFISLFEDFRSFLREIPEGKFTNIIFTHEELLDRSLDELESSAFLSFLRLVTSLEICKREDFYKPFLGAMKQQSMIEYCQEEVFPMGIEVDNVHIIALSNALRVPIRLENLDTSLLSGTVQLNHHDFTPELISKSSTVSDTLSSFSRKTCSSSTTSISAADPSRSSNAAKIHAADVRGTATLPESGSSEKSGTSTSNISSSDQQVPYVILLYRPGHYDILYPK
ncbi:uncharacterized protein [Typha angustifolia]|uniref:uncharacterized protein n=1 Tax=Typha angustifolia TaxID=59011 RepID=UPI003C2DAAE2